MKKTSKHIPEDELQLIALSLLDLLERGELDAVRKTIKASFLGRIETKNGPDTLIPEGTRLVAVRDLKIDK